ncbi:hypothetical protein EFA69_16215 [Rufibacter immobilis]|uniref:Uncharacterized protein n=1 Tax=Rufibacter immobilis TaxID=1348778 RepID=A0A3M9MQ49_9BACT|nr:hypothetical protein EFA69_16215 [Rufibacter immobilis]
MPMRTPKGYMLLVCQDLFNPELTHIMLKGVPIGFIERRKTTYRAIATNGRRKSFRGAKKALLYLVKQK